VMIYWFPTTERVVQIKSNLCLDSALLWGPVLSRHSSIGGHPQRWSSVVQLCHHMAQIRTGTN